MSILLFCFLLIPILAQSADEEMALKILTCYSILEYKLLHDENLVNNVIETHPNISQTLIVQKFKITMLEKCIQHINPDIERKVIY